MNPFVIAFRRIIYSIPLKWLLLGLAVFAVLLASFSSANYTNNSAGALNLTAGQTYLAGKNWGNNVNTDTFCMMNTSNSTCNFTATNPANNETVTINSSRHVGCLTGVDPTQGVSIHNNGSACNGYDLWLKTEDFYHDTWSSLQCQTEYNLIPVESVDQQYCTSNNLCPIYDCPTNPIGTGSLSNLYINNILHIGAPNIIMNIPEEIDWDYAYTMGGNTMNIDIVGYNQNYEQIEGRVETNNYKPTVSDFTNIFTGGFSNFGGLLIATLFVILVFYFVKKMFK